MDWYSQLHEFTFFSAHECLAIHENALKSELLYNNLVIRCVT